MKGLVVSIEGLSSELLDVYKASDMVRGKGGRDAIEWAFDSNPNAFAVARHDGRITGVSAYILSRMKFGKITGVGLQAVDSFVSTDMRGKGVFTQLARAYDEHARQSGADLVWGFPNDNAAPAWFRKLGWRSHEQVPLLVKPLRSGFFLRKLQLPLDIPLSVARDQNLAAATDIGDWAESLWESVALGIRCGTVRDREFLSHRLFRAPQANDYRVVADPNPRTAALVATREATKHGGRIAYLMEALGGASLKELLMSELGRLRGRGVELVLAWSFPWSPNYRALRGAGFLPLPERLRPIRIWFGSRPKTNAAACANESGQWYLSYLDSDTV
jgi:N-acetylglutamate synthase-like GNAT family acetyltransferase